MNTGKFLRHIEACRTARLPGERLPFLIGETQVGWVTPAFAQCLLTRAPEIAAAAWGVSLSHAEHLPAIAADLAAAGWFSLRNEVFDVYASDGTVMAQTDRGALPSFGIEGHGVHLNGLVRRHDGLHVWVARRALSRPMDPGKLDHLAAGGVPTGLSPWQTLLKEAEEEAGLDPLITARAEPVCGIRYATERAEGLRRDRIFCFDLVLPADFTPRPQDGEVSRFELWKLPELITHVAETDDFKFNVNLVLIDLFLRHGLDDPGGVLRQALAE